MPQLYLNIVANDTYLELGADSSNRIHRILAVVGVESPVPVDDDLPLLLVELGPRNLQRYVAGPVHGFPAPDLFESVHVFAPELK